MGNVENKNKKAKVIGAIALSAVLVSGVGYGSFKVLQTDEVTEGKEEEVIDQENENQKEPSIDFEKDVDGDYVFEINENKERNLDHLEGIVQKEAEEFVMEDRSLDHLEDIVLAQAEEDNAGRDLDHLEDIVLAQAKEDKSENQFVRNDEGLLVFDGNETEESEDLLASIDNNVSVGSEEPTDPVDPKPEKPTDPVPPTPTDPVDPKPEKPTDPVPPTPTDPVDPEPEKPTNPVPPTPIDPVDPEPEKPTDPVPPTSIDPVEPEKPTDPEPVITTDVSYKTDYLGFKVERIEDPTLEKGKEKVVQEGVAGSRTTKYKVTYENGKEIEREVLNINEDLPINKVIHVGTKDIYELESLINNAEGLVSVDYTEETWNVLLEKLDNAKNVLLDKDSSQKQVDLAKEQLENAIARLVETEEPTDPVDPEEPTDPVDPEEPTDPVDPEEPTDPVDPEEPTDPVDPEETE